MANKQEHLEACARLCRQFGGRLAIVSQHSFDDLFVTARRSHLDGELHEAPFTAAHGLHWNRKIVYAVQGHEKVGAILHEMGHVFATSYHPDHPQCREFDFFGWELTLARQIGAARAWSQHNQNYCVTDCGAEWGTRTSRQKQRIIADRLSCAHKIGILDNSGVPRSVR